jgi:hypothetical protein
LHCSRSMHELRHAVSVCHRTRFLEFVQAPYLHGNRLRCDKPRHKTALCGFTAGVKGIRGFLSGARMARLPSASSSSRLQSQNPAFSGTVFARSSELAPGPFLVKTFLVDRNLTAWMSPPRRMQSLFTTRKVLQFQREVAPVSC